MKKSFVSLTVALLCLLISITGCNNENNVNNSADSQESDSAYNEKFEFVPHITTNVKPDQIWHFSENVAVVSIGSSFRMVHLYGDFLGGEYELIAAFKNGVAYARTKDGKDVYLDTKGNVVEKPNTEETVVEADGPITEIYKETVNGVELYGLKDSDGNIKTEPVFEFILDSNLGYYFGVYKDDAKSVFMDNNGNVLVNLPDGVIQADKTNNGKNIVAYYGYNNYKLLNSNGEVLNDTAYSYIGNFNEDFAIMAQDNKLGLINSNGNVIVEPSLKSRSCCPDIFNDTIAYIDENGYLCFANIKPQ